MAPSDTLWLDSDVLLDWFALREPWWQDAKLILRRATLGHWNTAVSPLTLANVHYVLRKSAGTTASLSAIRNLIALGTTVASLEEPHVLAALASGKADFEDELQIACATSVKGISAIITRNLSDYSHAVLPAMSASDWLARHPISEDSTTLPS